MVVFSKLKELEPAAEQQQRSTTIETLHAEGKNNDPGRLLASRGAPQSPKLVSDKASGGKKKGKYEFCKEVKEKDKRKSFTCGIDGCRQTCTRLANLRQHQMHIHNVNVVWRYCLHCNYRAKNKNNLKQHLSNIHNIGVCWYSCK